MHCDCWRKECDIQCQGLVHSVVLDLRGLFQPHWFCDFFSMSRMQNPPSSSITPFHSTTTSTNPNKQITHWTSRSSISQTLGFNINFTDFTMKTEIAMLDRNTQSFVQPSKTQRKLPVLKKNLALPLRNPSSQRQLKTNCSKAAKI